MSRLLVVSLTFALPLAAQGDRPMPTERTKRAPAAEQIAAPGQWTQWRGSKRDGHCAGPTWPESLKSLDKLWSVPLGKSYSGPIMNAKVVFTTESGENDEGAKNETVRAFDRETGMELWSTSWGGGMKVPFFAARNGNWIRSTPALDGDSIYVGGMPDILACLDAKTGKERWRLDLRKDMRQPMQAFGNVCSPLVRGEHLYVHVGGGVLKLEKATGKLVWQGMKARGSMMSDGAFSSPIIGSLDGKEQLIVQMRTKLAGVDLDDGAELWSIPVKTFRGMNILTPLMHDGGVFTSAYGGRAHYYDVSSDDAGRFSIEEKWNNRAQGYMTSPVKIDGYAYLYLRSKRFACVNLNTGDVAWISEPIRDEYASLVAQGNRVLALTSAGELFYLRHNPEKFDVIDRVQVADAETWAHLAVDGNQIFVRELEALTAFRWK